MAHRSFFTCCCSCDGNRSSLLRMLWLWYHYRQYSKTMAGRSKRISILNIDNCQWSDIKVQVDRQHIVCGLASRRSAWVSNSCYNVSKTEVRSILFFSVRWNKIPNPSNLGNFELLIDEELAAQDDGNTNKDKQKTGAFGTHNRWK